MTSSHPNLTVKIFTLICMCTSLSTSLHAMENIDETTDSTSTQMIIIQTAQEKLIDHFSFKCDLVNENSEISISDSHQINNNKLKWISAFNANLISIPQSIGKLRDLISLYLGDNKLKSLPDEIGLLNNLENLNVRGNQLQDFPSSFENLTSLEDIDLSNNKFHILPQCIYKMTKLSKLCLENNQLIEISQIGKLKELKELTLFNNQIKEIPENIGELSKLSELSLSQNKITGLPRSFGKLLSLNRFWIENNELCRLPLEIHKLNNLSHMDLKNNDQLGRICQNYGNIYYCNPGNQYAYLEPLFLFNQHLFATTEQNLMMVLAFSDRDWCSGALGLEGIPLDIVQSIQRFFIELTKHELNSLETFPLIGTHLSPEIRGRFTNGELNWDGNQRWLPNFIGKSLSMIKEFAEMIG